MSFLVGSWKSPKLSKRSSRQLQQVAHWDAGTPLIVARVRSDVFGRSLWLAGLALLLLVLPGASAHADGLDVQALSQSPANIVSRSAPSISYTVITRNFDAGGSPTTIGVGIEIQIDGSTVNANSGVISASGCVVDPSFTNFWACTSLAEGGTQTITFTWNEPEPGVSTVEFIGFCQVLPIPPGGYQPCTTATRDSVTTSVSNLAPNGVINQPDNNVTIVAGGAVSFAGTATDPEGDTPFRFLWNFDGGAPNSALEDPGPVTFSIPGVFKVSFLVTDAFGATDPTPGSIAVSVTQPFCGDGNVDPGELCDHGVGNGGEGSCCSTSCDYRPAGQVCGPAIAWCREDGVCSGASASCPPTTLSPAGTFCGNSPSGPCDAQDVCNGVNQECADIVQPVGRVCGAAAGLCDAVDTCDGQAKTCADRLAPPGTLCRAASDACDAADFCDGKLKACADAAVPSGTSCSDGDACTSGDACDGSGTCLAGSPLVCDDQLFCDGTERCDSVVGCLPGTPPDVDDDVACTDDSCDEATDTIVNTPDDALCEGTLVCRPPVGCLQNCFGLEGQPCDTGLLGLCSAGLYTCPDGDAGNPACIALNQRQPEACDGQDADCDGTVECEFTDWGEDLELAGGLIFVAAQQAGLRIAVLNGNTPLEIGAYDPGSCTDSFTTRELFVDDVEIDANAELAYLAAGDCGVLIVDVRVPDPPLEDWSPPLVASFDTAGWSQDVDVVGGLAYVADHNGGLSILDVSGLRQSPPQPPRQLGGVGFVDAAFGAAIDVEVQGEFAYVATTTGLQIVDVSDPELPMVVGKFATDPATGPGQDVEVVQDPLLGTLVYLAAWLDGVYVIDADDPSVPVEIAHLVTSSASFEVTVTGITALVADGEDGLRLYDVSLAASPLERAGSPFATPGWAWDVEIANGLAYIAYGEDPFGQSRGGLLVLPVPQLRLTLADVEPIPEPDLVLQTLAALTALTVVARMRRGRGGARER